MQPEFLLPWQHGQAWLTGSAGFHNANDAIDFFPPDTPLSLDVKCEGDPDWVFEQSSYYVLSSAPGVIVQASNASVLIDHAGGWRSRHYHMTGFVVEVGDYVAAGQRLGRPSTLGFCSSGPHNHFWIQGPNGETTADVTLSAIPATEIGINKYYSATFNFVTAGGASPPPAPTATPPPVGPLRGDANCDGVVSAHDAMTVLWIIAGHTDAECGEATADTDCDGLITIQDALNILLHVPALSVLPAAACPAPTPTATPVPTPTPTPIPSPTMIPDDTPTPTPTPPGLTPFPTRGR
ncbi:MAG: peptidoglycan DD-metalloendopeptidase family protein [Chloroflexi bacterium]|nr:peptidoglycan DD-metalloendopeptidase family protein [Chloroflexota bacterium]